MSNPTTLAGQFFPLLRLSSILFSFENRFCQSVQRGEICRVRPSRFTLILFSSHTQHFPRRGRRRRRCSRLMMMSIANRLSFPHSPRGVILSLARTKRLAARTAGFVLRKFPTTTTTTSPLDQSAVCSLRWNFTGFSSRVVVVVVFCESLP